MGFNKPAKVLFRDDPENATNPLGKTAFYDPGSMSITLYTTNRHPKDIMRSLSHELVHHTQNCNGQFDQVDEMGEGYAQNDEHLREMEREAYEKGNLCFRDWEDSIKGTIYNESLQKGVKKQMSLDDWKNKELSTLLTEKWGFGFNLLAENDESKKVLKEEMYDCLRDGLSYADCCKQYPEQCEEDRRGGYYEEGTENTEDLLEDEQVDENYRGETEDESVLRGIEWIAPLPGRWDEVRYLNKESFGKDSPWTAMDMSGGLVGYVKDPEVAARFLAYLKKPMTEAKLREIIRSLIKEAAKSKQ
jgi:hypothetical protein